MSLFSNEDGLFQKCFGFLGKLIAINFLWMICSLPIITIGASTTAMYYSMLKLHKYGDCSIRDYMQSFRQNFRQATGIWIILCIAAGMVFMIKNAILAIPLCLMALYIFPTLAAFENKTKVLFANAFFFSLKNVLFTVAVAAISIFPMLFTLVDAKLFPIYLFVWLLCGFALTAYANAWFFYKIFRPYLEEKEENITLKKQQYVP